MVDYGNIIILTMLGIAGLVGWFTYKAIKEAKPEQNPKVKLVYLSFYLGAIILFILLRTVGSGLMNKLFYALGGSVK